MWRQGYFFQTGGVSSIPPTDGGAPVDPPPGLRPQAAPPGGPISKNYLVGGVGETVGFCGGSALRHYSCSIQINFHFYPALPGGSRHLTGSAMNRDILCGMRHQDGRFGMVQTRTSAKQYNKFMQQASVWVTSGGSQPQQSVPNTLKKKYQPPTKDPGATSWVAVGCLGCCLGVPCILGGWRAILVHRHGLLHPRGADGPPVPHGALLGHPGQGWQWGPVAPTPSRPNADLSGRRLLDFLGVHHLFSGERCRRRCREIGPDLQL